MKKIISIFSTIAILLSMAVSVSAAEYTTPTIYLEVSGGTKAGDVVTVVAKYAGFDVTPYDDADTGAGYKLTGAQARVLIPGGIGTAADGEQFLRPGVTQVNELGSGSAEMVWEKNENYFTFVLGGASNLMEPSGTLFTISMKLNKDVTSDLEFAIATNFENGIYYDYYEDWEYVNTIQEKSATLVGDTLEAPAAPEPPVQEEPETGDIVEVDGKTAVIDDAGKTRFVVEDTKASVGKTTAASILKVTYAGTTKQANLWNLLKVEEGATGEIAIGNLTVKVILGTDVIDANSVGSLSIAVQ